MVKVAARESTGGSGAGVGGERWVAVEDVMPMSDYDLEVYSTYRHQAHALPAHAQALSKHRAAVCTRAVLAVCMRIGCYLPRFLSLGL